MTTGLVAGLMLGRALIPGRLLDWLLASDPRLLASTYPAFASSAGRSGLTIFYAICGLPVIGLLALLAMRAAGEAKLRLESGHERHRRR